MPTNLRAALVGLSLFSLCSSMQATIYRHITAETVAPYNAVINSDGSLTEDGINYACIYKPVPQASWVRTPWISPSQAYSGSHSIGLEVDPQVPTTQGEVDKVQQRISSGNDSFALTWGVKRYTGFAVKLPSANFQIPTDRLMIAQWWQGSPYGPPVRIEITNDTTDQVTWKLWILNNDTLGNPSATPIVVDGGTIPFDTWSTFVVMLIPDYTGNGQIKVWQDGTQVIYWTGKVGYDPSTIPYKNPPAGTANPNNAFDVFYGPYRNTQNTKQQMFFDEIKFTDTYSEALP
ncbi:polysaccharide lyase [Edaphobacter flagellatus]|uniref:polysaccharide lyase n=1 Tax=Edaphobacter flagellatus TaxID=1933044 RepID=UPI0021B41342|nr:polysaccharide lyase [Edaphobacter flagellatus]